MPKTEDIRSAHTRQILRDTIQTLLDIYDFEAITVNCICTEAGISRTTFYFHYEDKYDLMVDCIKELIMSPYQMSCEEPLEPFFIQVLSATQNNAAMIHQLEKINGTMELKRKLDKMFLDAFIDYYNEKYPSGKNCKGMPNDMTAAYHCYGTMHFIEMWFINEFHISKEYLAKYLTEQMELD